MTWSQNYTPLADSIGLSVLVAALPVVTLLALLAFWHVRAHIAALVGLLVAAGIALGVYGMPAQLTLASAGYGAAFGLVQRQAAMMAFIDVFWVMGLVFIALLPLILLMRRPGHHEPGPTAAPE